MEMVKLLPDKKGLTEAEIGLTQPENRPNSNFRLAVVCQYQKSAERNPASILNWWSIKPGKAREKKAKSRESTESTY